MRIPHPRRILSWAVLLGSVLSLGACASHAPQEPAEPRPSAPAPPPRSEAGSPPPSTGTSQREPVPAPPLGAVGREELVAHALASSPDLAAARARARGARAAVAAAGSALRPSLGLRLEGLRADAPSLFLFKRIDARALPADTDFNEPGAFTSFEAGLELRQNLWSGGRDRSRLDRTRAAEEASVLELAAARADLVAAVLDGYHALLAAGEAIVVAERSAEVVTAQLERVTIEHELGRVLRSDVLSLEVRAAETREALVLAITARDLAAASLLDAAGLSSAARLELGPAPPIEVDELPPEPDEAELLERARRLRPELEAARRRTREAHLRVREERAAWWPTADLYGRVYRVDESFDLLDADDAWAVGAVLGWDVLDGGRRGAGIEAARAGLLEARAHERRAELAIELDVRSALLRLRSARGRVAASRSAAELAEQNLALLLAQYEGGRVQVSRYLEAEADLLRARLRRIEAHHDLVRSRIQLDRASGALTETGGWPAP